MSVDPEAPATPPEPVEPAAVTPPVEPAAPVNPGPWAADLAEYFGDNADAIAAADRYMREKVQPRITTLETDTAPARELYKDLVADPQTTLAEVVEELYGEDVAAKFKDLFGEDATPAAVAAATASADEPPDWAKPLIERDQAQRDQELREAGQAEYEQALAGLRAAHAELTDADMELIHPFMAAAGGDTEVAYAGFQAFKAQFATAAGVVPPATPEPAAAPAVLNDSGSTAATPPTVKKYRDINEAMDDFFAERRAAAPPPVI